MTTPTEALAAAGVSIWLDDLSRDRITGGSLRKLIEEKNVVGVTTNPSIFQVALANGDAYNQQVTELAAASAKADRAVFEITTRDVSDACDLFADIAAQTDGVDGRVSIEVDPRNARDAKATVEEARKLREAVGKDNVYVKIPATVEALPAITETLAAGISVNVTLIFSLKRYREVINAFMMGLEQAKATGHNLSQIHSVASFFVSRVDTEVDKRLSKLVDSSPREHSERAEALKGKAGIANARLAYQIYQELFSSERWALLAEAGARPQRPLWASTGVKDPTYPDTLYVTELVAPDTVNTMPEKTLNATYDHAVITGNTIEGTYQESNEVLDSLAELGVSYEEIVEQLEAEGLEKFERSWAELLSGVHAALADAPAAKQRLSSSGQNALKG